MGADPVERASSYASSRQGGRSVRPRASKNEPSNSSSSSRSSSPPPNKRSPENIPKQDKNKKYVGYSSLLPPPLPSEKSNLQFCRDGPLSSGLSSWEDFLGTASLGSGVPNENGSSKLQQEINRDRD